MSIKGHIIENFRNDSKDSIMDAINSSVTESDEVVLPGLGVFFGLFWEKADDNLKNEVASLIRNNLDSIN